MPFEIISLLVGVIKNWIEGKQKLQQSKQETSIKAEENKQRLLEDTEKYNNAWEMAQLTDSDKGIRRVSFICFTAPFVVAIFAPNAVKNYFTTAIASIPDWYKATYMSITGAVWGISSLKNSVAQIINYFKK